MHVCMYVLFCKTLKVNRYVCMYVLDTGFFSCMSEFRLAAGEFLGARHVRGVEVRHQGTWYLYVCM